MREAARFIKLSVFRYSLVRDVTLTRTLIILSYFGPGVTYDNCALTLVPISYSTFTQTLIYFPLILLSTGLNFAIPPAILFIISFTL